MSELAQAVQEADAMEDALAAPLFDGVRAEIDMALNGLNVVADAERARVQELIVERDAYLRAAGEQVDLRVAADKERDEALRAKERVQELYEQVSRELAEARHAKAQMELRWQAAEKECAALRAQLGRHYAIPTNAMLTKIRACQATHPGQNWCEKCR